MTDQQINIAIAEHCGWTEREFWEDVGFYVGLHPARKIRKALPDYCNDLNAIHEAEMATLKPSLFSGREFRQNLLDLCGCAAMTVHATARQRAEAFLRTIGKWEDKQ